MTPKNIEQASPDVREVLFKTAMQLGQDWPSEKRTCFRRFLDAEAYTDAALMLVPEGWCYGIMSRVGFVECGMGPLDENAVFTGEAATTALAIAAASLRAKGPGHEQ